MPSEETAKDYDGKEEPTSQRLDSRAVENSGLASNERTILPSVQRDLATFVQHVFSFSRPVTIMGILSLSKQEYSLQLYAHIPLHIECMKGRLSCKFIDL